MTPAFPFAGWAFVLAASFRAQSSSQLILEDAVRCDSPQKIDQAKIGFKCVTAALRFLFNSTALDKLQLTVNYLSVRHS